MLRERILSTVLLLCGGCAIGTNAQSAAPTDVDNAIEAEIVRVAANWEIQARPPQGGWAARVRAISPTPDVAYSDLCINAFQQMMMAADTVRTRPIQGFAFLPAGSETVSMPSVLLRVPDEPDQLMLLWFGARAYAAELNASGGQSGRDVLAEHDRRHPHPDVVEMLLQAHRQTRREEHADLENEPHWLGVEGGDERCITSIGMLLEPVPSSS